MSVRTRNLPHRAIWGYEYGSGYYYPIRVDSSGYTQSPFGRGITTPPAGAEVSGIYFNYDASGFLLSGSYRENGAVLFTLNYSYDVTGNLINVTRK